MDFSKRRGEYSGKVWYCARRSELERDDAIGNFGDQSTDKNPLYLHTHIYIWGFYYVIVMNFLLIINKQT